ncbi:MAG: branched-chain amino acid ABC transporter substrate-binding protein [Candidatus Berkiella sp.]
MRKLINKLLLISALMITCTSVLAQTIKIGVAASLSGANRSVGYQQWQGVDLAVQIINQNGGINGNKIELIDGDDRCDPDEAIKVAKRLVQNKVTAVIGHTCSGATLAAQKIYNDANIVMITPSSTDPNITNQGLKLVFRTCGTNDMQADVAANFITKELSPKKIAIVYVNIPYASTLGELAKKSLEKHDANIVLFQAIEQRQWNFDKLLQEIKEKDPDVIYFAGMYQEAGRFLRKLREQRIMGTFVSGDGIATSNFVQAAGGPYMVKGVYMTFFEPAKSSQASDVMSKFEENRIKPDGFTLNAYAAMQALAQAIKQSGSFEGKKIGQWLHSHDVQSVIGDLQWNEKGDLKNAPFAIYQWNDDGEYERY